MTVVTETTNGRLRGRVAPLPTFTFPDSGITVQLPRLAPDTQAHIARTLGDDREWATDHPRPEPPIQTVEAIDGPMEAPNTDDPDYKKALSAYLITFQAEVGRRMLELAIDLIDVDVDTVAVEQRRRLMAKIGAPLPDDADDREIYIKQICISSAYDSACLMAHVQGTAAPTKEGIQAALDMFRDLVSR